MKRNQPPREKKLIAENKKLRRRLEEAEQTIEAIHRGEVDALVISGPQGDQIYTLTGAERPYRVLLESINEGAVTMTCDGSITYCNNRFTDITKAPPTQVINSSIYEFFSPTDRTALREILHKGGGKRILCASKRRNGGTRLSFLHLCGDEWHSLAMFGHNGPYREKKK